MPELPEVETVVRDIRPRTVGRLVAKVRHASKLMARSTVGRFGAGLTGRRVEALDRLGKWMFFRLSDGNTLVVHLGMTGHLLVVERRSALEPHTHLRLALDAGDEELRFTDPRRFGRLLLCDDDHRRAEFGPDKLGPEATSITPEQLARAFTGSKRTVKSALLDQRRVAGVGNIYADEILFRAGVHPHRAGASLSVGDIERITRAMHEILAYAIERQGTTIRNYVTGQGAPGDFQTELMVYGRMDEPCKACSGPIAVSRAAVAGRSSHFCPVCQPESGRAPGRRRRP